MRILCVIDSLGSGGAQRQMVNLACGLKAKGHDVELLLYFPELVFFRREINDAGIPVHEVKKNQRFSLSVTNRLIKLYLSGKFDGVISFLDVPNFYVLIAKLLTLSKIKVVVSERASFIAEDKSIFNTVKRWFYCIANYVVSNSNTQAEWLKKHRWLKKKVVTIYNGYVIDSPKSLCQFKNTSGKLLLIVIGRIESGKNGFGLLNGLIHFFKKHKYSPTILWVGRLGQTINSLQERKRLEKLLLQNPEIAENWYFLGERSDVSDLIQGADALIHVSLHEGLPNAICEAFVSGLPVIASNVCDHPILVEEGVRGFLCDPYSPESICNAIERFNSLSTWERQLMGKNAKKYAEVNLSIDRMISEYERLLL